MPPTSFDERYWLRLVSQVGAGTASALSAAQDALRQPAAGAPAPAGLDTLKRHLEQARRVGLLAQQIARVASGEIRQEPEEVSLTSELRDILGAMRPDIARRGIELRRAMHPATVLADPTLLHAFLQHLMLWSLARSRTTLDVRLELQGLPPRARLTCQAGSPPPPGGSHELVQGLAWCLVEQLARALQLDCVRQEGPERTQVDITFPQTIAPLASLEQDVLDPQTSSLFGLSQQTRPLAGSHWLVVIAQRDLRAQVRDALRPLGTLVDFVGSVQEAESFCREALPHGLIYESVLGGERLERLRHQLQARASGLVMVEIGADGHHCEFADPARGLPGRVGRDGLADALPALLEYEFTRPS